MDSLVTLKLNPAVDSLREMLEKEHREGEFDLAFIDADKPNHDNYYEAALKLVRKGGMILLDNCLWSGKVVDEKMNKEDENTRALHNLNEKIKSDPRVLASMLPIADGLLVVTKL